MKVISIIATMCGLLFAFANAGDYVYSCMDLHLVFINRKLNLKGWCRKADQSSRWSEIDLNRCLVNNQGYLGFSRYGSFQGSCIAEEGRISLNGGRFIEIMCYDGARYARRNIFDLNYGLKNDNGQLKCDWE